jgi:hypothetical protein
METRKARAEYYFQTVQGGQRDWYPENAGRFKRRHVVLAILVIVRDLRGERSRLFHGRKAYTTAA